MNRREDRKHRFGLTLLVSGAVFVIITAALGLALAILYLLLRLGVIHSIGGEFNFGELVALLLVTSAVLGFIITMLTGKISLRPFNRIIDKLNRLAKGDFTVRIHFGKPIGSHPTFREIENSFNRAAEELAHTELLRSDFADNFSHEFKTPIVSIAGFAKLLRLGSLTEEQKQEYLCIIEEESMRLSRMATSVLNLSRVENLTVLTDITRFNLSEQLRSAGLLLADKWSQKELEIEADFGEYMIDASEELLKQLWINLLDNAIKFSDPGGTVTVTVSETDAGTAVSVSNTGQPIPEECLDRIFNKFYQADESHSTEGSGIGLAIVKKVSDLHSASVKGESRDGITTFTVLLPPSRT